MKNSELLSVQLHLQQNFVSHQQHKEKRKIIMHSCWDWHLKQNNLSVIRANPQQYLA